MTHTHSFETLPERFSMPETWQWRMLSREWGEMRYGYALPRGKAAVDKVVVVLPGLSEFCEKYFEIARDCLAQGYGFLVVDWRGQGKSSRYLDNLHKRHSQGFEVDAQDLNAVLEDSPFSPRESAFFMMANSMGGNIGLRYLEAHLGVFKGAAFCAPLIGLHAFSHVPGFMAKTLTYGLEHLWPEAYAPMGGDWDPFSRDFQSDVLFSSDAERAAVHNYWMKIDKALQVGHITHQWLYDAHRSCVYLQNDLSRERIDMPCLFFMAGHEQFVDNEKIAHFTGQLSQADLVSFPDACHEIWMECDAYRDEYLNKFYSLVKKISLD